MSRARIIDLYVDKLTRPDFEFHQIRQELEANKVDDDEIRIIVKIVDNEIQRRAVSMVENRRWNALIYVGGIITAIGAVITIGTFIGMINTGNSFIIAYGPFLGGLSILVTGLGRRSG
jgi:hypothetical protein